MKVDCETIENALKGLNRDNLDSLAFKVLCNLFGDARETSIDLDCEPILERLTGVADLVKNRLLNPGVDNLEFGPPDSWQYTDDLGLVGRFDTFIPVKGHPRFDAIRYYFAPGSYEIMEWVKDGDHFDRDGTPISDDIKSKIIEIVADDLKRRFDPATIAKADPKPQGQTAYSFFKIHPGAIHTHPYSLGTDPDLIQNGPIEGWMVFGPEHNGDPSTIIGPIRPVVVRYYGLKHRPSIRMGRYDFFYTRDKCGGCLDVPHWYQSGMSLRFVREQDL